MSDKKVYTIYAKRFVRGKESEHVVLGHVYGNLKTTELSALIRDHALQQDIDVVFQMRIILLMVGQIARQFKRSAPKTCWVYFVQAEREPNIGSGFTDFPAF